MQLHQLLTRIEASKHTVNAVIKETAKVFKDGSLFRGMRKKYTPLEEEGLTYPNEEKMHQWMSRFEAIPAVLGLILMSLALFHWHREQQIINNRLIKSERFYREHSFYDFVTGLYSASYMKMQIQSELNHLNIENTPFCVSLIDIKSFEPYLRQHGVTAANTLLSDIGSLIQVNIRKSDLVCRYAGDLYIVLMPNTQLSQSKLINQHVVKMIQQHVLYLSSASSYSDVHHTTIQATQGDDVERLLQRLNALLQQEKRLPDGTSAYFF